MNVGRDCFFFISLLGFSLLATIFEAHEEVILTFIRIVFFHPDCVWFFSLEDAGLEGLEVMSGGAQSFVLAVSEDESRKQQRRRRLRLNLEKVKHPEQLLNWRLLFSMLNFKEVC
jgi:hypothetical protein